MRTDFDIVNDAFEKSVEKYPQPGGIHDMPEVVRALVLVWTVDGIIGNGGFEYLFESPMNGDPSLESTVRAFEIVGLHELHKIVKYAVQSAINERGSIDLKKFMKLPATT